MRLWKHRFTILLPYSACCIFPLIPPPSMRYVHHMCLPLWSLSKHSLLSQYCWGRWKATTIPVAAAALKKHCFLGHLLSTLLVGAQFSSSLSECYHYRPLSWVDSGGHRQVLCPLEHNIYIRVGGVGGWNRALSHTRMTLKMILKKLRL